MASEDEARKAYEGAQRLQEKAADGEATISPLQGEHNVDELANQENALSGAQQREAAKALDSASSDFEVSEAVRDALLWAKATANARGRNIDAHAILIGLLLHSRSIDSKDAAHFL